MAVNNGSGFSTAAVGGFGSAVTTLPNSTSNAISDAVNKAKKDVFSRILPDCYLYISHLDEEFQYWQLPGYPEKVTDDMKSSFVASTALGRSAPVYTFSNAGPRTVQINLSFHRDMFEEMPSNVIPRDGEDKAESFIHALQAIAVPKYNLSNKAIEPPLVAIRLGREVFIKGVVTSGISVTYGKPILVNEKYAIIETSFTVSEVDPYDASTVFKNGSFRGFVNTMRTGMNF